VRLDRYTRFLAADDERSIVRFVRIFKTIQLMHAEHSNHEEQILYPFINGYFPGYCRFVTKVPRAAGVVSLNLQGCVSH
jgi:hypothetical protein